MASRPRRAPSCPHAGVVEDAADLGSTVMNGIEAVKKGNYVAALPALGGLIQMIGGFFGAGTGK